MRGFNILLQVSALAAVAIASPIEERQSNAGAFSDVTVFSPPSNYVRDAVLYARSIQLSDGSLLATHENYSPEPPQVGFPIYRSTNYGRTWTRQSWVNDTRRGLGARYQPFLYQLPAAVGNLPAGTVLLAGNFIPTNLGETHLDLYASRDGGRTWAFVSNIANGGRAYPNNGETPVWEPFVLYNNGDLIVYYADQRDPAHGQKTVHQISRDGINWGPVVNDVRNSNYADRPGMPVVARLANGKWMLVYEFVGAREGNAPAYYKIANDPYSFDSVPGVALIANNGGERPQSSPYIVVTNTGRIIVSGGQTQTLFVNDQNGASNAWRAVNSGTQSGYSRALTLIRGNRQGTTQYLGLTSGGWFGFYSGKRVTFGSVNPANL